MAVDIFIKIDGIPGEAQDAKHKQEIDVVNYSIGASQAGAHMLGGGGGAGKVQFQDFHFTKYVDASSHLLMQHCANGKHIPKAFVTVRKAGGEQQEFLKFTLSDILVSSFQHAGDPHGEKPTENISLNFSKIEIEYKEQKPDGSLGGAKTAGWHVKENKWS